MTEDQRAYLQQRIATLVEVLVDAADRGVRDIETENDLDDARDRLAEINRTEIEEGNRGS